MTEIGTLFLVLAIPCVVAGVVLMMAMAGALHSRGHRVDWVLIRLFVLEYVARYREVTTRESGRPGPLFYPFLVSMNAALVLVVLGLALQLA